MQFKKAALNKKYIITGGDPHISTPDGYRGKISEIQEETVVTGLIERGSNLVALKPAPVKKEEDLLPPPPGGEQNPLEEETKNNTGKRNK